MAENETLDLWDGHNSRRWRHLLAKIERNEFVEEIADEGVRCLYRTFKNLAALRVPWEELLGAAERGDHQAIRDLVRRCPKARDYLQLFQHYATIHSDRTLLVERVACAVVETILDQIEMKLVGERQQVDMASFRARRAEIITRMQPGIARLAKRIVATPTKAPRMPAKSPTRREQEHRELLELSLRQP